MTGDTTKKHRSPEYPSLTLEEALVRAKQLLDAKFGKHLVPVNDVLAAWNYSPGSGKGLVALAALMRYGLMGAEGSRNERQAALTEWAYEILIDEREESEDRLYLVQRAALAPHLNAELWQEYGADFPPDSTLKFKLRKLGFSDAAASSAIEIYKATISYAKLPESDIVSKRREEADQKRKAEAGTWLSQLMRPVLQQEPEQPKPEKLPLAPVKTPPAQTPPPATPPAGGSGMNANTGIPIPIGAGRPPAVLIGFVPKSLADLEKFKVRMGHVLDMWFEDLGVVEALENPAETESDNGGNGTGK